MCLSPLAHPLLVALWAWSPGQRVRPPPVMVAGPGPQEGDSGHSYALRPACQGSMLSPCGLLMTFFLSAGPQCGSSSR